jgi:hypothetical protein
MCPGGKIKMLRIVVVVRASGDAIALYSAMSQGYCLKLGDIGVGKVKHQMVWRPEVMLRCNSLI